MLLLILFGFKQLIKNISIVPASQTLKVLNDRSERPARPRGGYRQRAALETQFNFLSMLTAVKNGDRDE